MGILARRLPRADMESADTHKIRWYETEMPGDFAQISIFGRKDAAIGEGNMKEPAEKVFENCPIVCEQPAHLAGVALESRSALSRKVEDEPNVLFLSGRDLKYFAKGSDFVSGNEAVGSRHFGAESDHRDRERDTAARIIIGIVAVDLRVPACNVARRTDKQRAQRATEGQLAGAVDDASDKAHGLRGVGAICSIGAFILATYGTIRR